MRLCLCFAQLEISFQPIFECDCRVARPLGQFMQHLWKCALIEFRGPKHFGQIQFRFINLLHCSIRELTDSQSYIDIASAMRISWSWPFYQSVYSPWFKLPASLNAGQSAWLPLAGGPLVFGHFILPTLHIAQAIKIDLCRRDRTRTVKCTSPTLWVIYLL